MCNEFISGRVAATRHLASVNSIKGSLNRAPSLARTLGPPRQTQHIRLADAHPYIVGE